MNIRKIKLEDSTQLFYWVNNSDSLSVKIENQKKINFSAHSKWFIDKMNDPNTSIWIIENKKKIPIGQIRFQKKMDNYFDVDIYLTKDKRKNSDITLYTMLKEVPPFAFASRVDVCTSKEQDRSCYQIIEELNDSDYLTLLKSN